MDDYHRKLGLDRAITRRDFLNGAAISVAGAYTALRGSGLLGQSSSPTPALSPDSYPPLRSGLRGNSTTSAPANTTSFLLPTPTFASPMIWLSWAAASLVFPPRISTAKR